MLRYAFELIILLIPVAGYIFYFSQEKKPRFLPFFNLYLLMLVAITVFALGKFVYESRFQPPEWDFLGFWIGGNVAVQGENFYQPENHQSIQLPYEPSEDFRTEIIDVGFWYPPFTIFLFLPLGLFELSNAYLIWQIFLFMAALACIYGIWRLFLKDDGIPGLLLIAVLFLRLLPVRSTIGFAQTNFLTLLFFLVYWRFSKVGWGGVGLALSVVVKPYMALMYGYPFLNKQWKVLGAAIGSLLAISMLSLIVFGPATFFNFFADSNVSRMPAWIYIEPTNQSLLATILRMSDHLPDGNPIFNLWYLAISAVLTLITLFIVMRKNGGSESWKILALLFLALIIYPANQQFYSVFLIIPVVMLIQTRTQNIKQRIVIFITICVIYLLSGFNESYEYMFYANLFTWGICIYQAVGIRQPDPVPAAHPQISERV